MTATDKGHVMIDFETHMKKLELESGNILSIQFGSNLPPDLSSRIGEEVESELKSRGLDVMVVVSSEGQHLERLDDERLAEMGLQRTGTADSNLGLGDRILLEHAQEFFFQADDFQVGITLNKHPSGEGWAVWYEGPDYTGRTFDERTCEMLRLWLVEHDETGKPHWLPPHGEDFDDIYSVLTYDELRDALKVCLDYRDGRSGCVVPANA